MTAAVEPIRIVAAVIADDEGRILLVRKRGSPVFIQPGGKREPGEHAAATLTRELAEELGVTLVAGSMRSLGTFEEDAVNEPGRRVRADAYFVCITGEPQPRAEIAELEWMAPDALFDEPVAPLSARFIVPAYRAFVADPDAALARASGTVRGTGTAARPATSAPLPPLPLLPLAMR